MGRQLALFSMRHRRWVFAATALLTLALGAMIPWLSVDTDPENMLDPAQPARVAHNHIKADFGLSDMIVVGVVNRTHPDGIYNPASLGLLQALTQRIQALEGVVAQDLMSLATVDNVTQVAPGTLSFDWLLGELAADPAAAETQALALRDAVARLPMFMDTLVSGDGHAAAIYVPITDKNQSYRISRDIEALVASLQPQFGAEDEFHITGQPVAQDTFGVEMFQQMAVSAPLAGLLIFLVMLYFFRSVPLVVAPMLLAMATVIATMGLLIGMGYTVHIMSSMIPIFLMPIAVVASVHVLSGFADRCTLGADTQAVMADVMESLYKPVIFTALTTTVGFLSLTLTPIPPVKVFGAFVAFGVLLAMVLTLTFIPAFVAALPQRRVDLMVARVRQHEQADTGIDCKLCRLMAATGQFATRHGGALLLSFVVLMLVAAYGINQIQINDNPTRWFKQSHKIRVADQVLNSHFAGTYEAYLVLRYAADVSMWEQLQQAAAPVLAAARAQGENLDDQWQQLLVEAQDADASQAMDNLLFALDDRLFEASAAAVPTWEQLLQLAEGIRSGALYFQQPAALTYMADLQAHLRDHVGKTNSLVDLVRTINRELVSGDDADYQIPATTAGVAQAILSFQSSHRPDDLWHFVTPDYQAVSIWLQLASGDNQDMQRVVTAVNDYVGQRPLPAGVSLDWGGSTYINLVWQGEMVTGMLYALLSAFVIVLVMMIALFRSFVFGVLAVLPLTLTIALIYGVMGLTGKYYDMPVAVLSSLSLGLSVDFAIHFIQRLRVAFAEIGDWRLAISQVFEEPARAITRNALVISLGFLPLLAAPLVPYITVGAFLASIMAVSAIVTLLMLPALLRLWPRLFFGAQS